MKLLYPKALSLVALALAVPALAAPAAPVALGKAHLSSYVRQISVLEGGKLCIVGQSMDPDGDLQSRGTVALFDIAQNKLLWQQTVKAPGDNAASRFVACRSDGKSIYVGANVDTHSERSLAQGLAYLYRFDTQGKVLAVKEVVTGAANAFVYDLEADGAGVQVAGIASDVKAKRQGNAIFFAKLDLALKQAQVSKIDKGAYASGAAARLAGGALVVAGNFLPASASTDDLPDDYATSRLAGGKYQFSVRPQKAKAEDVASVITATGEIVSLGVSGKSTTLTVVGADGKVGESRALQSSYCQTGAISADLETVYAARTPCGRSMEPAKLVAIARKSGVETVVKLPAGEPVYLLALEGKLFVVARKGDGSLSLHTLANGG